MEDVPVISFQKITDGVARAAASKWAVAAAFLVVVAWAATGPHFHWSDSHSLFINTLTTVVTFWLGFLILAAQYRGDKAISVKLDELIRALEGANNRLIALEDRPQDEIEAVSEEIKTAVEGESNDGKTV
jgi:low affinity Fe/Cu permease